MTNETMHEPGRDDEHLASLIRQGGPRAQPPEAVRAAVRAATHAEWRAVVAGRAKRRVTMRWSLAAAASVAALAVWLAMPLVQPPAVVAGSLARVTGPVEIGNGGLLGNFGPARAGAAVMAGQEIRSGTGGRAALDVGGVSLRLDEGSVIALAAADRVDLRQGAVYVDAPAGADTPSGLVVETAFGTVAHLGTQYETRVSRNGLRVRVREGRVLLAGGGREVQSTAGEQVTLSAGGEIRREPVARAGADWAWTGAIAPGFDIDDRPLEEFLGWVGRETGREVRYASPASREEAASVVLRGSVDGLTPDLALAAVMSTTRLDYSASADDRLVIDFRTGDGR